MPYLLILGALTLILLIANIYQYNLSKKLHHDIQNRKGVLDTLLSIGKLFVKMDHLDDYSHKLLELALGTIPKATRASFLIYNDLTGRYEYKTCIGYDLEQLQKVSFTLEETFLYKNAEGNYDLPTLIRDVSLHDSKFLDPSVNSSLAKAGGLEIKETLSAPVVLDQKIVAILNIDSELSNTFDETDQKVIHHFANHIAIALKNKHLIEETINLSKFDSLTGTYSRSYFEKLFKAYRTHTLDNMESYSLVMCDLNNLKLINDHFGHSAGDQLLVEFSKTIQGLLKESDIFARVGGDEFAILFRNLPPAKVEEKMREIVTLTEAKKITHQGISVPMSFSYGIASSPEDSMVYEVLVRIADVRMYQYKEKHRKPLLF